MLTSIFKSFLPLGCVLLYLPLLLRLSHPAPTAEHRADAMSKSPGAPAPRPMLAVPPAARNFLAHDSPAWYFGELGYILALPVVPLRLSHPGA